MSTQVCESDPLEKELAPPVFTTTTLLGRVQYVNPRKVTQIYPMIRDVAYQRSVNELKLEAIEAFREEVDEIGYIVIGPCDVEVLHGLQEVTVKAIIGMPLTPADWHAYRRFNGYEDEDGNPTGKELPDELDELVS